jgi:hypothetical protein
LPEEWLIERIQQVGANPRKLLSPSFIVICGIFAAVFCNLRYIFVTADNLASCRKKKESILHVAFWIVDDWLAIHAQPDRALVLPAERDFRESRLRR